MKLHETGVFVPSHTMMELLAPAGSPAALHAAVRGGADAVYLGLEQFNARRGADNFTIESLREACRYAHTRGVSIYITLNTVALPSEIGDVMECARQAWRAGADAFIVQDVGIAHELMRTLPQAEVHASTQMNIHSAAGVEFAAQLGCKRVTLARELSLEEVSHLCTVAADLGMEVEIFAHGALCVCYSGQCLMSSMIGGRSANRGTCAQACRLPYELYTESGSSPTRAPGEHLLSPKDLCTIDMLPDLSRAGVSSLKIEGRMKSPEYVYAVVSAYRAVLDRLYASEDGQAFATKEEKRVLSEAFSRGFSQAYLVSERGNDMMSYQRPNNRGVLVGRVSKIYDDAVFLDANEKLVVGDLLEAWTKKGRSVFEVRDVQPAKGNSVKIPLAPGDRSMRQVRAGDRVFRIRSAEASYDDSALDPRVPVNGRVTIKVGAPLKIEFSLAGHKPRFDEDRAQMQRQMVGVALGPEVEPARTKPLTKEDVRDHVDRLGQTSFVLESLDILLDEAAGLGFSQLHKVRTQALDDLQDQLVQAYGNRVLPKVEDKEFRHPEKPGACQVACYVTNPACARAARRAGADVVYVSALNYKRGAAVMAGRASENVDQAGYPKQCVLVMPTVDHDDVEGTRENALSSDVWQYAVEGKPLFVDSAASLLRGIDMGCECEVGPHVPVMNALALDVMARLGVKKVWLSPELNLAQIKALSAGGTSVPLGITVIGTQELMITEHCLLMSQGPCNQDCENCVRRQRYHYLKDRKGFDFPIASDCLGRTHLYNSVVTDIAHAVPDLIQAGVTSFMVDATLMNVEQTAQAVGRVVRARDIGAKDGNSVAKVNNATSGHLFRGVS